MRVIDTLAFLTITTLLIRLVIIFRLDSHRGENKNRVLKLLFGGYVIEAMIPTFRAPRSEEERHWIKVSNLLVVSFYLLFIATMVTIWTFYS